MQSLQEYISFLQRCGVDVKRASDREIVWTLEQRGGVNPALAQTILQNIR